MEPVPFMIRGASIQAVERGAFIGSYSFAFAGTGDQGKSGPAGADLYDDKARKRLDRFGVRLNVPKAAARRRALRPA
ncbi:hypothetical protein WJ52_20490 [Burkholderia ubonensis]|uniref:hypothetical protein n=1 Tax=Burkholderia ubonensis TaxID=101571 RepID=UPI00075CDA33|nr:hypothetical protein [Burkholderia ubonensis]KVM12412.1 hypothetical protein WJ52_20490 [Burkholderia ubonensis]